MKNSKKMFLSLSAFACVLGLAACGGVSTALPPSNSGSGSSTPSTSTPAPAENTFGTGITDDEKAFFPSLISGTGDFTKNTDFTATSSLTDRFDVKVGGTLKYIIYKGAKANGFDINITAYIGVDVSTFQISGFKTVGDVHSYDTSADISSLPLVGTDGNITVANGSMSGATVSANTLVDIAKEAVAQAKVDAGSSTAENTFGDGITADEKEIFPGLISGTGDFTKNTDFTATGSLTDRFDVKVGGTLKFIIYKGSVKLSIPQDHSVVAYVGVNVETEKISGYEIVGDPVSSAWMDSYGSEFDGFGDKFVGTDGNITDTVSGATVSSDAFKTIAKDAVAQAKVDAGSSTAENTFGEGITDEQKEVLAKITSGDFTKNTTIADIDFGTDSVANGTIDVLNRFDVSKDGTQFAVVYETTIDKGWGTYLTAYVGVDTTTFLVIGVEFTGTMWSQVSPDQWTPPEGGLGDFNDKFVGTDGNIADNVTGLTQSSTIYKSLVKSAVAQAKADIQGIITQEEVAALNELAGTGTWKRNVDLSTSDVLVARYDVTENGAVTKVIYKGTVTLPQKHPFVAYVAVNVNTHLITGYKTIGDVVSSSWSDHASSFEGWEDKFVGTNGSTVTDNVTGATKTSEAFKTVAKAAVAQSLIDYAPKFSDEELAVVKSLAGDGTYEENENFTPTDTLTARFDVTENAEVTKVIYKGEVALGREDHIFVAYVAVDVDTKLITGYETIGEVVSDRWTSHAGDFEGWEDKFVGTDGSTDLENVVKATLTSNAFKNIAKAAVAQAIIDFAPALSAEETAALETLSGTGTYSQNTSFTATNTLTARYDVTEGDAVTKVIYKGEVALGREDHIFVAYVAVDVNTKLITGYEVIGDVVSSTWTSHAPSFDGWEDKFVGTDGTTVTDTVAGATLTSNAFKDIAKDAVAQAIIDFE